MFDFHLAEMYEVLTKNLNLAVKRNSKRFPSDFMFQLTKDEWDVMRLQIETASQKKRNITTLPYVFTEQGLAMLSGVLNSDKAIDVNVAIMRAFVMLRKLAIHHKDMVERIDQLEAKYDDQFKEVFQALKYLLEPAQPERTPIGFKTPNGKE